VSSHFDKFKLYEFFTLLFFLLKWKFKSQGYHHDMTKVLVFEHFKTIFAKKYVKKGVCLPGITW
jgi:hypothetical protein